MSACKVFYLDGIMLGLSSAFYMLVDVRQDVVSCSHTFLFTIYIDNLFTILHGFKPLGMVSTLIDLL